MNQEVWKSKKVLATGHTGFKGGWLSLWFHSLGAIVIGCSRSPPTQPSLFETARVGDGITSILGDMCALEHLEGAVREHRSEMVFHLAAQALVRYSYAHSVETIATDAMGTVNLIEAARSTAGIQAVVCITSDKCHENRKWYWGYYEDEPMGAGSLNSCSKGRAELVISAYRRSFFEMGQSIELGVALDSAPRPRSHSMKR